MCLRVALLGPLLALAVAGSGEAAVSGRTAIAYWSPFEASGGLKQTLKVEKLGRGRCIEGSAGIGGLGYRCSAKNSLGDPCWRDGAQPTELVACVYSPWSKWVGTIRVPRLMFGAGVTFAGVTDVVRDLPWGIELVDGNRCVLAQGAHGLVSGPGGRRIVADWYCAHGIVLLRNLRRGRAWRVSAAYATGSGSKYVGEVSVRRAVFGSLPPPMRRQDALARRAAETAAPKAVPMSCASGLPSPRCAGRTSGR